MRLARSWPGALLLPMVLQAQAQVLDEVADDPWQGSARLEAWGAATWRAVRDDSLLNPGNALAALGAKQAMLDARLNARAGRGPLEAVLYARLVEERSGIGQPAGARTEYRESGRLLWNQAFVRYKSSDALLPTLTLGRELLAWGPAQFRSPSNPFYFDSDRSNPLAATPGVDLLRASWHAGAWRVMAAQVFATTELRPALDLGHTALFKLDRQGGNYVVSLVAARQHGGSPFIGGFAQWTPDDAWLVYAEYGAARQPAALLPGTGAAAAMAPLYTVQRPAPRQAAALAGASYTLENGQVLTGEYLHDDNGYQRGQLDRYFSQAALAGQWLHSRPGLAYPALGQALGLAPRLLGRDYLSFSWQSNGQDSAQFWRLGWTRNLTDRSGQVQLFYEKSLARTLSGFVSVTVNSGGVRRESGVLMDRIATVGLKWFVL